MKSKSIFALLLAAAMLLASGLTAFSAAQQGDFRYTVTNGAATVTGYTGPGGDRVQIPDTLGGATVTAIGEKAFANCKTLTGVVFPSGLTRIGDSAFMGSGLQTLDVPEGVTALDWSAFEDCAALTSVTLPQSLRAVSWSAFSGCAALRELKLPDGLAVIDDSAFEGCAALTELTLPDGLTQIGSYAFSGCTNLRTQLPQTVQSIGRYAFSGCAALTRVTISGTVDEYAFYKCTGLTAAETVAGVTALGNAAFSGCAALADVTLNDGLTQIGARAFADCAALREIALPQTVETIGVGAFAGSGLQAIELPGNLSELPASIFSNCAALTRVVMQNSLTKIGARAFEGCAALTDVRLSEQTQTIGEYAFSGCIALPRLAMPKTVAQIDGHAFYNCPRLVFRCVAESYALDYAMRNGIPYRLSPDAPDRIDSELYRVSGEYIFDVPENTTVRELRAGLIDGDGLTVYRGAMPLDEDAVVGTGAEIRLYDGQRLAQTARVVIHGDVNGDGQVRLQDITDIALHLSGMQQLVGAWLLAANESGAATLQDLTDLAMYVSGNFNF